MKDTLRLSYLTIKQVSYLDDLWENCFQGDSNMEYIDRYSPYKLNHKKN